MSVQQFPSGNRWKDLVDYEGDGDELFVQKNKRKRNTQNTTSFPNLPPPKSNINYDIPKYIVIKSNHQSNPLQNHSVFAIKKALDAISTNVLKINMLKDNSLLILTKNKKIAEQFIKTTNLGGFCSVSASYHQNLNYCKATIYDRNLINVDEKEILECLKSQGVVEIYKFLNKERKPSGSILLTFDMFEVPKSVDIAWYSIFTREYYPNPMRCRVCQKLGHTNKRCNGNPICNNCNLPEHIDPATKTKTDCTRTMCANCLGEHPSSHAECPSYQQEKAILKLKIKNKISLAAARSKYAHIIKTQIEDQEKANSANSYSETLKNSNPPNSTTPNQNSKNNVQQTTSSTPPSSTNQLLNKSKNHNTTTKNTNLPLSNLTTTSFSASSSSKSTLTNSNSGDDSPNFNKTHPMFKKFSNSAELLSSLSNKYVNKKNSVKNNTDINKKSQSDSDNDIQIDYYPAL